MSNKLNDTGENSTGSLLSDEEDDVDINVKKVGQDNESASPRMMTTNPVVVGVAPPASSGLSELSRQLRALQHKNHSQAAQIDKLERKLQILSDLKGVSVNDLKSALQHACQGEAFNELRMEVETLRAQLDIASLNTNQSTPTNTNTVANLELRIGQLEEVEESLRNKVTSLYDSLREQTTKSTRMESSATKLQSQLDEYQLKYETLQRQLQQEHDLVVKDLKQELDSTTNRAIEAECYLRREKERVSALIIQVAEYTDMEIQINQQTAKIRDLNHTLTQQETESASTIKAEVAAVEAHLESMKERAVAAESKLQTANEKIQELEQQSANTFSLEVTIAEQKAQINELRNVTGNQETERNSEMDKLQKRAAMIESNLQEEVAKSAALAKDVARLRDLEQRITEQDQEIERQKKKLEKYKKERDKALKEVATASKDTIEGYENRLLELTNTISIERMRTTELENELTRAKDLEAESERQKSLVKELKDQAAVLNKENDDAKVKIGSLESQLLDKELQLKVQQDKAESLQTQLKSTEDEATLRKKQFKSRFMVQDERIEDLEQQLSSLVTAFNLERGERTEEHKTQAVMQQSLSGADEKVAHQLHTFEEVILNPQRSVAHSSNTFGTPQRVIQGNVVGFSTPQRVSPGNAQGSSQRQMSPAQEPFSDHSQVGIIQGYLFKKEQYKGWKKRYFFLHGNLAAGVFKLSYGDGPSRATKGSIVGIRTSISRVQLSNEFPKQQFCFVLRVNPYDSKSPTIHFAAQSQDELDTWMTALNMATQGVDIQSSPSPQRSYPVGSKVVIVDLLNHPDYNGLSGTVTTPLKDDRQCVSIDSLQQKVKLSPANLELFALPDSMETHNSTEFM